MITHSSETFSPASPIRDLISSYCTVRRSTPPTPRQWKLCDLEIAVASRLRYVTSNLNLRKNFVLKAIDYELSHTSSGLEDKNLKDRALTLFSKGFPSPSGHWNSLDALPARQRKNTRSRNLEPETTQSKSSSIRCRAT